MQFALSVWAVVHLAGQGMPLGPTIRFTRVDQSRTRDRRVQPGYPQHLGSVSSLPESKEVADKAGQGSYGYLGPGGLNQGMAIENRSWLRSKGTRKEEGRA